MDQEINEILEETAIKLKRLLNPQDMEAMILLVPYPLALKARIPNHHELAIEKVMANAAQSAMTRYLREQRLI